MNPCSSTVALEGLLAGTLAAAETQVLRAHLTTCPQCQAALDRLSDHPSLRQWTSACGPLPSPATETLDLSHLFVDPWLHAAPNSASLIPLSIPAGGDQA